ncbi:MAG TPA: phage portal protein [Anaerohalosphaeraceae bacterium]|nr:phage portal protein [Anaerohalosphaeraceae bacterium]HQI08481.1 phage portal protein [Anaerohalosphaeraceae bacterium]HQJ68899.1 phage portal protein [Anaerohalosphaeraceae bacterium]
MTNQKLRIYIAFMMKWLKKKIPHKPSFRWLSTLFNSCWQRASTPEELLEKNKSWVYACIQRNVAACSQVPLRLYKRSGAGGEGNSRKLSISENERLVRKLAEIAPATEKFDEILSHPILDLLRNVNPWQNAYDLKYITFSYLETLGRAFWYLEKEGEKIINIWPLVASDVQVIPDEKNGIKAFHYGKGVNKLILNPDKVIYFQIPSLLDFWGSSSPLMAAEQSADMLDSMNRLEITLFRKGGRPDAVLEIPPESFVSDEERQRLETSISRFAGVDNQGGVQGGVLILSGGAKLTPFGITPREMNYLQGRKAALEEICAIFGVPLSFVLIQEVSRANAYASLELWKNYTISPRLRMVEQKLNEQFVPHFGAGLYLAFDDPAPKDEEYRLKELQVHLSTNYSTINEERAKDGLPPVDWGDSPTGPFGTVTIPTASEETKETESVPAREVRKTTAEIEIDFLMRALHAQIAVVYHRILNEAAQIYLEEETKNRAFAKEERGLREYVNRLPIDKWAKSFEMEIAPFLKGAMISKAAEVLGELNPKAKIDASDKAMEKALKKRSPFFKEMAKTARSKIAAAVTEGIEAGAGAAQVAYKIRQSVNIKEQSEAIARTELIWAHNEAAQKAWELSEVVEAKQWDSSADSRCCELCQSMHGKRVGLSETFRTALGEEVDHPPLHPKCRCAIVPIIKE